MTDAILVLNAGSSSLKFAVFETMTGLPLLMKGSITSLRGRPRLRVSNANGALDKDDVLGANAISMKAALEFVVAEIAGRHSLEGIRVVGHRIVHGGHAYRVPALLDEQAIGALWNLAPLAPIHQPMNLGIVELAASLLPHARQVGCFDTAFHSERPRIATLYGLPRTLTDAGIVSYGFHGVSYGYIASCLLDRYGAQAGNRAIVCHLGSGASLCAMREGRSIATTMGFSPLDGLVMSTRCGSLDPGVVLHLLQDGTRSANDLARLLYEESGLMGVSEISGDMQTLVESDDARAVEAVDLFVYQAGRQIGSLAAALEGLDTLVFTAGIGENSAVIRERICRAARWLGVQVDHERNRRGDQLINAAGSTVDVLVIPTDEERAVAEQILASGL
jgi:acetate kinase